MSRFEGFWKYPLFGWVMFSYRTFTPELFGDHYSSWSRNEISMTSIQIKLVITYNFCSHIVLLCVICVHGPMVATPTQTDTTMANVCSAHCIQHQRGIFCLSADGWQYVPLHFVARCWWIGSGAGGGILRRVLSISQSGWHDLKVLMLGQVFAFTLCIRDHHTSSDIP